MSKIIIVLVFQVLTCSVYAKMYAVIVGVSSYESAHANLRFADDDARAFYNYLISVADIASTNISLLIDKEASKNKVISALSTQFKKATADDQVIFFFSGHGGDGKFLVYDSPTSKNYLLHSEIKKQFKSSKAKFKYCFADACHAGSIKGVKSKDTTTVATAKFKGINDKLVVFMSSRSTQQSQEKGNLQQGVFSYYLIEGLKSKADIDNDKNITLLEIYAYVRKQVIKETSNNQVPIMFGKFNKEEIIITLK